MIRINLLPVRAAQKKEQLRSQVVVLVVAVVLTLAVCIFSFMTMSARVDSARQDLQNKQSEMTRLKTVIGEVKGFEQKKKELTAKLDILDELKLNRTGPVRVLDELSRSVPDKAWVETFALDAAGAVTITGMGLSQEVVADFMRNLENSPYYQNVELVVIDQKTKAGRSLESFSIRCLLESPSKKSGAKGADKK